MIYIQYRLPKIQFDPVDKPMWKVARKGVFVSSDTWNFFRNKRPEVEWWHLIWFPCAIPKHAFILWLAVQNRLTTNDRLLVWGFKGDTLCGFCRHGIESRNHLFSSVVKSSRIWQSCMQRCPSMIYSLDWQVVLNEGCRNWKEKTLLGVLCRLVFGYVVYGIWRARNDIRFRGVPKSKKQNSN